MNRLKNVLLGSDFSPCSKVALRQAMRLAKWNNAHLHAIHVVNSTFVREYAEALERPPVLLEKAIVEAMVVELTQWLAAANSDADGRVAIGIPLDVLVDQADKLDVDLLMLGLHGGTGEPGEVGSLALRCLRKAHTKVMLVHKDHDGPFRNVVACVDFSDTSRQAVEQALRVGEQDHGHVHFMHVSSSPWRELNFHTDVSDVSPDWEEKYRQAQHVRLREFVGDTRGQTASFTVVDAGSVRHGITEYGRRVSADLLVMGSKGQSNLSYVLLGSTVERVLNELPCSMLVVRPPAAPAAFD